MSFNTESRSEQSLLSARKLASRTLHVSVPRFSLSLFLSRNLAPAAQLQI
jgi:hypothetical protein